MHRIRVAFTVDVIEEDRTSLALAPSIEIRIEEWAFFRREALRSRLVQALERLIERELVASNVRSAIAAATRRRGDVSGV
jgi:hypothetical protein